MSCRPDLYQARTAIDRLIFDLRDVEHRLACGPAQLCLARAREHLAAADLELGGAVQLTTPPALMFEVLR